MTIKPPSHPAGQKPQIVGGVLAGQTFNHPGYSSKKPLDLTADAAPGSFGYVMNRAYFRKPPGDQILIDVLLPDGWDSADCFRHLLNLHRRCAQAAREGHSIGNAELRRLLAMDEG